MRSLILHSLAVTSIVSGLFAERADAAPKNELSLAASVDSAYDDNVYNGRGPDFVNRISPHASWRLIDRRITLETDYDMGYWTYALGKADNSLNHRARFDLDAKVTRRLTVQLGDEFNRAEDPGFLSRVGIVAPQIGILDNIADALVGYAFTRRFYASAGYTFHHTTFDGYSAAQLAAGNPMLFDGDEHDAQLNFSYRVTRRDDFHFGGRFQAFSAGPQNVSAERWLVGTSYAPSVGWRHQFFKQLEANADVGPLFYQRASDSVFVPGASDSGVTWRLGARLKWFTDAWRGGVSFTRDMVGATGTGSALWADFLYVNGGFHYHDRVEVTAGVGYFRNGRAPDQAVAYDGVTADMLVDFTVVRYFRIGAYYTVRWQEIGPGAIAPGAPAAQFPNITRNIVGLRLLAVIGAESRPPKREAKE